MSESAAVAGRKAEPAGARPASQGAQLDALAQAQLSGAMRLVSSDAEAQIERFCDPQLLASGKVNIVSLEAVQQRFGDRWQSRKDQVFDFAERVLERGLDSRGVFVRVSDMDYFIVHPDLSRLAGQAACLRYLREILTHFLGDARQTAGGILQVTKISHGRAQAEQVDALAAEQMLASGADEEGVTRLGALPEDSDVTTRLVNRWTPFVAVDGRQMRVSATLEPVYELKGFTRIGFRMLRRVIVIATGEELSAQQVGALSAADVLRADLATITRGIARLRAEAGGERQLSLIVPLSFTSLSSQKGRSELVEPLKEASGLVRLGVVCEILDIEGVPPGALLSAASLVRPFSLLVVGRMASGAVATMDRLKGAGLQALSFECPTGLGDAEFMGWATATIAGAKRVAKSVLVYRVSSPQRAATLSSLGATHVSLIGA
ncbi:MAG TPA: hypothetical protein VNW53_14770 [Phenylobacterium sp.]|uniref:hypothetical protein n=1 Tax=Phenylobacterium sp. TaxID=1871053 RepID=UPI002CCFA184|nr:hypothetical protein [Phenylobacterium sp.]HXA40260.1 hypothetical protein [Phenylobacterium sp.]